MTRYQKWLLAAYILLAIPFSIHPLSRTDWIAEFAPAVGGLVLVVFLTRAFKISNLSYTLILLYLVIPIFGSHYGVTNVPLGFTLGQWLHTTRNMYDRFGHFFFGFCSAFIVREIFVKTTATKGFWSYWFPVELTLSLSAIYEIFEWIGAQYLNPRVAATFIGAQGDFWDTPKDMATATVGAIMGITVIFAINWWLRKHNKSVLH